jgi:uncharacterized membrane protein (DUF106 family)
MFDGILSFFLSPILAKFGAGYFTIFMAFFMSLITTYIYMILTPQAKIKRMRAEVKNLNNEIKQHIGNIDILKKIQKEITNKNMIIMSYSVLPNIFIVATIICLYSWMGSALANDKMYLFWFEVNWFIEYIVFSICSSIIIRKILDVY